MQKEIAMQAPKKRGRKPLGKEPLEVVQVLLPPELVVKLKARAEQSDQQYLSAWVREKLTEIERTSGH